MRTHMPSSRDVGLGAQVSAAVLCSLFRVLLIPPSTYPTTSTSSAASAGDATPVSATPVYGPISTTIAATKPAGCHHQPLGHCCESVVCDQD